MENNIDVFSEKALKNIKIQYIFNEILQERKRQDNKWGEQNHPIVNKSVLNSFMHESVAKDWCDNATKNKELTWGHIIIEEISEAMHAKTIEDMRTELVQCAAVLVAMIESLDRNER